MTNPIIDQALAALEPCPFCGATDISTGVSLAGVYFGTVECNGCGASMYGLSSSDRTRAEQSAITAWNTRQALQSLQEGWRAIDSAPKDGTWFLAYWPINTLCDRVQSTSWEGRRFMDGADFFDWCQPTHWMPLPPAPGEPS